MSIPMPPPIPLPDDESDDISDDVPTREVDGEEVLDTDADADQIDSHAADRAAVQPTDDDDDTDLVGG